MEALELLDIISTGETSRVQFKESMPHKDSVAQEIVAMANSLGGVILFGVEDATNIPKGLPPEAIEEYDRIVSQVADNIKPTVYIQTEVVNVGAADSPKNILVAHVPNGYNKPYKTDRGNIYVKQGANKRLVLDNGEIMRLFQKSGNLLADEMPIADTSIDDIDERVSRDILKKNLEGPLPIKD